MARVLSLTWASCLGDAPRLALPHSRGSSQTSGPACQGPGKAGAVKAPHRVPGAGRTLRPQVQAEAPLLPATLGLLRTADAFRLVHSWGSAQVLRLLWGGFPSACSAWLAGVNGWGFVCFVGWFFSSDLSSPLSSLLSPQTAEPSLLAFPSQESEDLPVRTAFSPSHPDVLHFFSGFFALQKTEGRERVAASCFPTALGRTQSPPGSPSLLPFLGRGPSCEGRLLALGLPC